MAFNTQFESPVKHRENTESFFSNTLLAAVVQEALEWQQNILEESSLNIDVGEGQGWGTGRDTPGF